MQGTQVIVRYIIDYTGLWWLWPFI